MKQNPVNQLALVQADLKNGEINWPTGAVPRRRDSTFSSSKLGAMSSARFE
jgi:hypothetical protein